MTGIGKQGVTAPPPDASPRRDTKGMGNEPQAATVDLLIVEIASVDWSPNSESMVGPEGSLRHYRRYVDQGHEAENICKVATLVWDLELQHEERCEETETDSTI
ncbi:hypothetical protein E3N88_33206 [Mikania micrantha]|uniref:Uncharacterized protein n=1 Tax=Mikania micrantha TaxID=192012 RepID=A0A5N6MB99_9ASTR|nr:hypothetical protein E3N88_33206 [Mikania micrantha]